MKITLNYTAKIRGRKDPYLNDGYCQCIFQGFPIEIVIQETPSTEYYSFSICERLWLSLWSRRKQPGSGTNKEILALQK